MPADAQIVDTARRSRVTTGAEVLARAGFDRLVGRRVGLITNHTGRVGSERLVDAMARASGVRLTAVLSPEHGLTGAAEAGAKVQGGVDAATGVKVLSLYGHAYKPTPDMLADLDVLVFDMQDIGTRFYTYISTMGLAMQAAAAAGLPFLVLDRPNPLGGDTVSGFMLETAFQSFVGRFEIPIAHGLTIGELAHMIKGRRLMAGLDRLELEVVGLEGWQRGMRWPETGLPWVATSPNIPTFETALAYAGTGLFEATTASEGRGTDRPFLLLGHPDADADAILAAMAGAGLPGVRFVAQQVTPRVIAGVATSPRFKGRTFKAVRVVITDPMRYRPVETGVHLLAAFASGLRAKGAGALVVDAKAFDRLAGTDRLRLALARGATGADLAASWAGGVAAFERRRAEFLRY